jgi:signal transduction histidine kinase
VSQVVHDYGDVCQTITDVAVETNAPISTEDFATLNLCLDDAIAGAVTMYQRESQQSRLDEAAHLGNERMGFLVHELRNLVNTSIIAFEVLKTGNVGVVGSTGAVLNRSLVALRELVAGSIDEVRLTRAVKNTKRILISAFIEEVAASARLDADARGIKLIVSAVQEGLAVEADRPILAAVVGNLLQNAFKFTRPHSTVTLKVGSGADRVVIEVEDECGGLPGGGDAKEQPPSFEQRSADRTGLGLGLAYCRWGAEENGGRLYTRNLPDKGCVFSVDLPRSSVPAAAPG